jgi:hypothetical protein
MAFFYALGIQKRTKSYSFYKCALSYSLVITGLVFLCFFFDYFKLFL